MGFAGELFQQGAKIGIEQAGKAFKKLAPSALDNIRKMGGEMNISPKSMYDLDLHLKRVPEDAADVESMFKGMKAEEPDAFEAADGFFHTLGFGNDAAAKIEANTAVKSQISGKAANVTPQPEPPPVHNLADINQQKQWKIDTLSKWLLDNEAAIRSGELDATAPNFGEIIYKNKRKRVSTSSIKAFLDDPGNDVKLLKLKDASLEPATRDIQADFANIDVAVRSLETANAAFTQGVKTAGGKRAGVNPEWLNPESMRKGTMRGANYAREITRKIRKMEGFEDFDVQQGHAIDLSKGKGTDVHRSFMAEPGIGNRASNRKAIGGSAFDNESMAVLEQPGGGRPDLAEAIKSTGQLATQRKEEYKQFGWLQAVWDQALIAMETKGKGMDEVNKLLKAQRDALKKGELAGLRQFKLPGSKVTLDDMLVIQQKALQTGDPTSAAEEVLAQRELFEWGKANGLVDNPDTFKLLKKYMKDIDTRIKVEDAKAAGPQKFEEAPLKKPKVLPRGPAQTVNWNE